MRQNRSVNLELRISKFELIRGVLARGPSRWKRRVITPSRKPLRFAYPSLRY